MREKYEQLKANTDVQVDLEADNHLFYKACGGWSNRGIIHGLAGEYPFMFENPSKSRGSSTRTSFSYSSPLVTQLQHQLQTTQTELQTIQTCLHST